MRFGCRHRHHRHHRCEPIDVRMHIINNIIENLNRLSTLEANILSVILSQNNDNAIAAIICYQLQRSFQKKNPMVKGRRYDFWLVI